jgi:CRISPR-associated protein Cas1
VIKRTLEISQESVHLAVQLDQLKLYRHEPDSGCLASVPCEDIGLVVVDNQATTYSHAALARLIDFGAAVLVCGRNHLPTGLLLPFATHTEVVPRIHEQIAVSKPVRKQLWSQIVAAKVRAQAANLTNDSPAKRRLLALARDVKSGDPTNVEAQAAKIYWSAWLGSSFSPNGGNGTCSARRGSPDPAAPCLPLPDGGEGRVEGVGFHRDPDGTDALNAMLNYGYAVLRAAVGRALVSAGLLPALGLKHSNRSNAFCLADDLLEPVRPLVDRAVRDLHRQGVTELNKTAKTQLLGLLTATVRLDDETGPLMVVLHRTVASLVRCFEGQEKRLLLPEMADA